MYPKRVLGYREIPGGVKGPVQPRSESKTPLPHSVKPRQNGTGRFDLI